MTKERGLAGVQKATSSSHGGKSCHVLSGTFSRLASCLNVKKAPTHIQRTDTRRPHSWTKWDEVRS